MGLGPNGTRLLHPAQRDAIEAAEFAAGFPAVIEDMGGAIDKLIEGRWEYFAAAVKKAPRSKKSINDLYKWCIATANAMVREGQPAQTIPFTPKPEPARQCDQKVVTNTARKMKVILPDPKRR